MNDLVAQYERSLAFWNETYTEGHRVTNPNESSVNCAVVDAAFDRLASAGHVLDFGCGSGWASFALAVRGARVLAIDPSESAIREAAAALEGFERAQSIELKRVDDAYLDTLAPDALDGLFSCNMLDVVPGEIARRALERAFRVLKPGAPALLMLNPYVDSALAERLRMEALGDGAYAINGVLRCVNRTREEWEAFLSPWFDVLAYDEMRFEGEPETLHRRLFTCARKA